MAVKPHRCVLPQMTQGKVSKNYMFWEQRKILNVKWLTLNRGAGLRVESSWNVMAHGDAQEGKWRGNWRMERVASILHTTAEHGVSSITTADAHTSAASSRLNWRHRRFKLTRTFRRKTKSGFCACTITFQTQSTSLFFFNVAPPWVRIPCFSFVHESAGFIRHCVSTFCWGLEVVDFVLECT